MENRSEHSRIIEARRAYARLLDASYGVREVSWRKRREAVSELAPLAKQFIEDSKSLPDDVAVGIIKQGIRRAGLRAGVRTVVEVVKVKRAERKSNKS